ncbi:D-2-hydroxyacid dehydrogenase [Paenibacillus sp. CC-CFT747]|nr:D-2-hydroxyacid dehydrogenase [Paenibacillus sp. CC-CFT747]
MIKITAVTNMDLTPLVDNWPRDLTDQVEFTWYRKAEEALPHLGETEGLLTSYRLQDQLLDAAPKLKWVQVSSAGVDMVPLEALADRNIVLTNSSGVHSIQMSEHALGAMLYWARRFREFDRSQQEKRWARRVPTGELHGQTVGILGTGSIGKAIAQKAKAFGMTVYGYNRSGGDSPEYDVTLTGQEGLTRLLRESDYVVSLLPKTAETEKLLGLEQFQRMKINAYFINMGRGEVVDESALIQALNEKWIAGAALDVFEEEPLPEDSPSGKWSRCS